MEQSVSGKSHGRFFKRLSQRIFFCVEKSSTWKKAAADVSRLLGNKPITSGTLTLRHEGNSELSKPETMADKSLGKVPVERLIVLITEHVDISDISNGL